MTSTFSPSAMLRTLRKRGKDTTQRLAEERVDHALRHLDSYCGRGEDTRFPLVADLFATSPIEKYVRSKVTQLVPDAALSFTQWVVVGEDRGTELSVLTVKVTTPAGAALEREYLLLD